MRITPYKKFNTPIDSFKRHWQSKNPAILLDESVFPNDFELEFYQRISSLLY